jgi:hypothetical protein
MRRVQSVAFASADQELLLGLDNATVIIAATDAAAITPRVRLANPVASPFDRLLFGTRGKELVIAQRGSDEVLAIGEQHSFGVLAVAFTRQAVVVSETDGSVRAFRLSDGKELIRSQGWFTALGAIGDQEIVVGWSNIVGEPIGELVRLDLDSETCVRLQTKDWQFALPVLSGTVWVFADGSLLPVA